MTWALKRRAFYVVVLILGLGISSYLLIRPSLNRPPTCNDGKQNGDETGVDCGGSCQKACIEQTDLVSVVWSRAFRVVPGRYNAVAYLENHNKSTAVKKINYRFRFADANNVYIGKRESSTFIPPTGVFAVFEPGIDVGNSIPVYTSFEFTEAPQWLLVSPEKIKQVKILVSGVELTGETSSPKLSASIKNNSLFTIPEVRIVAILYDKQGNAVSASQTYLGKLAGEEKRELGFTWPEPFPRQVIFKEIIPMYDIFSVELK